MKYNVRLKTTSENGVFEMEVEEMICKTCRYVHIRKGIEGIVYDSYQCWGRKRSTNYIAV